MQVTYKSSYEYDAEGGAYKRVDKGVAQYSFDDDFINAFDMAEENGVLPKEKFQSKTSQNNAKSQENIQSAYANMSNIYAYRFKQEETPLHLQQNKNNSVLSNLLSAI